MSIYKYDRTKPLGEALSLNPDFKNPKIVVAFSGGMDSTTLLASLVAAMNRDVIAVTVQYGSKHQEAETAAAGSIVQFYRGFNVDIVHKIIQLPDIFKGAGSALMDESKMPHQSYEELMETKGPSPTVVPFRNANIISVCTAIAVAEDAEEVYVATHSTDSHNWAYPDCTPEFLGAMMNAVFVGTYNKVRLVAPFIYSTKAQVVGIGHRHNAPFSLSYSCYEGRAKHCGICPTCVERKEAFLEAHVADPTEYEV